jgi:hypothetical protein
LHSAYRGADRRKCIVETFHDGRPSIFTVFDERAMRLCSVIADCLAVLWRATVSDWLGQDG